MIREVRKEYLFKTTSYSSRTNKEQVIERYSFLILSLSHASKSRCRFSETCLAIRLHQLAKEKRHDRQDLHETRERPPRWCCRRVPAALVDITVHKSGDEVRFGWKQMEAPAPAVADAVVTTSKPKAATAKMERVEQNGVKRPKDGGLCAAVWEWLDAHPTQRSGRESRCAGKRLEREQRGLRVLRMAQIQRDQQAGRRQRARACVGNP